MTRIGDRLAGEGTTHINDGDRGDKEVGYFNMIDYREEEDDDEED